MKKKIPWHYHDRARGIYYDGIKEIDLEPLITLKELYDYGNTSVLNDLVDKIIEAQEEKNYKIYLEKAATNGNDLAKGALMGLEKAGQGSNNEPAWELDGFVKFILVSIFICVVAFIGIWYYYTFLYAFAFLCTFVLLWVGVFWVIAKIYQRKYNNEEISHLSDYEKYSIDLATATTKELVEHFHMTYSLEDGCEFVTLGRNQYVLNERKDIFVKRKNEVLVYLKERQSFINSYYDKLDKIPGLAKYFQLYDMWHKYNRLIFTGEIDEKKEDVEADKFGLPRPSEVKKTYPRVSALMEGLSIAENYPYNDIGNVTIRRIINGEDYDLALKDVDKYINGNLSIADVSEYAIDMKKIVRAYLERNLDADVTY